MNFRDGTCILLPGVKEEGDQKIVTFFNKKKQRNNFLKWIVLALLFLVEDCHFLQQEKAAQELSIGKLQRENYPLEEIVADYDKSGKKYPGLVKRLKYTLTIMTAITMKKSLRKVDDASKMDMEDEADI